jgi:hypothetical protein
MRRRRIGASPASKEVEQDDNWGGKPYRANHIQGRGLRAVAPPWLPPRIWVKNYTIFLTIGDRVYASFPPDSPGNLGSTRSMLATAIAAIPSPLPMNPSPSFVVAFTPIRCEAICSVSDSFVFIA